MSQPPVNRSEPSCASSFNLIDISQAARLLGVSESWIRRHKAELPIVRVGRLLKVNATALSQQIAENSLKPERTPMPARYQRGYVRLRGKQKVWYGLYREDSQNPDGSFRRIQRQ